MPESKELQRRPLRGLRIGLSLSGATGMRSNGFREADIPEITLSLTKRLISLGAAVVLGHQWRPDGIMDSIVSFTQVYRSESGTPAEPIIYNLLAAPDVNRVPLNDQEALRDVLSIEDAIRDPEASAQSDPQIARRMNLCCMRQKLADLCDARICLGGKLTQKDGRTHGVIEEAYRSLQRQRPVFFCGLLKGTTQLMIEVLQGARNAEQAAQKLGSPNEFTREYLKEIENLGEEGSAHMANLSVDDQTAVFEAGTFDALLPIIANALADCPRSQAISLGPKYDVMLLSTSGRMPEEQPSHEENSIRAFLAACGLRVWSESANLHPGENWRQEIQNTMRDTTHFLVLLQGGALEPWLAEEIVGIRHRGRNRLVIQVLLPGVASPAHLPSFLADLQMWDLREGFSERKLHELVRTLVKTE